MSLDHGILNVPLAKRSKDIDAQIDAYKATQAATEKAARKAAAGTKRTNKALAKVALAELIDAAGVLDAKASELYTTRKTLIKALTHLAKWQ
jgi:hypothetical protein